LKDQKKKAHLYKEEGKNVIVKDRRESSLCRLVLRLSQEKIWERCCRLPLSFAKHRRNDGTGSYVAVGEQKKKNRGKANSLI